MVLSQKCPNTSAGKVPYSSLSFADFIRRFYEALEWLKSLNVLSPESRFDAYGKLLDEYLTRDPRQPIHGTEVSTIANAAQEATYLVEINQGLEELDSSLQVMRKLARFTKGQPHWYEDEENENARDFGYELLVASSFARRGIQISVPNDADVLVHHQGHTYILECKNPRSRKGMRNKMPKILNQLEARYKRYSQISACHGVLCFSANRALINNAHPLHVAAPSELTERCLPPLQRYLEEAAHLANEKLASRNPRDFASAIHVTLSCPAIVESDGVYLHHAFSQAMTMGIRDEDQMPIERLFLRSSTQLL